MAEIIGFRPWPGTPPEDSRGLGPALHRRIQTESLPLVGSDPEAQGLMFALGEASG